MSQMTLENSLTDSTECALGSEVNLEGNLELGGLVPVWKIGQLISKIAFLVRTSFWIIWKLFSRIEITDRN